MKTKVIIAITIVLTLTAWTFFSKLIEKGEWKKEREVNSIAQECYKNDQEFMVLIDEADEFRMYCQPKIEIIN